MKHTPSALSVEQLIQEHLDMAYVLGEHRKRILILTGTMSDRRLTQLEENAIAGGGECRDEPLEHIRGGRTPP